MVTNIVAREFYIYDYDFINRQWYILTAAPSSTKNISFYFSQTTLIKNSFLFFQTDPYVKICLICQGKRIKKKKTTVKKNTLSPVYNEALVFDLPAENVYDITLLVKVIDYDR